MEMEMEMENEEPVVNKSKKRGGIKKIKKIKSKWTLSSRFLFLFYSFILTIDIVYILTDIFLRIYFNRDFWNVSTLGINVIIFVCIKF